MFTIPLTETQQMAMLRILDLRAEVTRLRHKQDAMKARIDADIKQIFIEAEEKVHEMGRRQVNMEIDPDALTITIHEPGDEPQEQGEQGIAEALMRAVERLRRDLGE